MGTTHRSCHRCQSDGDGAEVGVDRASAASSPWQRAHCDRCVSMRAALLGGSVRSLHAAIVSASRQSSEALVRPAAPCSVVLSNSSSDRSRSSLLCTLVPITRTIELGILARWNRVYFPVRTTRKIEPGFCLQQLGHVQRSSVGRD